MLGNFALNSTKPLATMGINTKTKGGGLSVIVSMSDRAKEQIKKYAKVIYKIYKKAISENRIRSIYFQDHY